MNLNACSGRTVPLVKGLALVAMFVAGLGACKKMSGSRDEPAGSGLPTSSTSPSGAMAPTETGPIVVGHFASMTGSEATFGISTDNGIRLALEERNAAGGVKGRKVEIKTLDTASRQSEGGTVVSRLINNDHVVALLGEVSSGISIAGGNVAQKYGVPMISPSSTNERVTKIGDMIFRVCFLDSFQGYVVAKFAHDDLKLAKVAVLFDQNQPYSTGMGDEFKKEFSGMGGEKDLVV